MALLDLFCDVVEIGSNVGKIVIAPIQVVTTGVKAGTKVIADLAESAKDAMTGGE